MVSLGNHLQLATPQLVDIKHPPAVSRVASIQGNHQLPAIPVKLHPLVDTLGNSPLEGGTQGSSLLQDNNPLQGGTQDSSPQLAAIHSNRLLVGITSSLHSNSLVDHPPVSQHNNPLSR